MATQTQTIKRPALQAERVHDYLYDPHYQLASERDHARATFKAHTSTTRVKRVPNYSTMFSELRHHPRFQMRLDVTDPVPKFISRQWHGYADQAREQLIRYKTFNYDPSVQVPKESHPEVQVSGPNRYRYFTRPIIPFLQQVPPNVLLASASADPLTGGVGMDQGDDRPQTPPYRTIMTQTDYRDSEAQTDPYTPEYVVRPGSQPELLTLATLSYGRGLPAGLAEIEMIERARAKREWEATLPPLNDVSQLEKRRKMMDDMERQEWALREAEIEKLQEARLEVLKKLLRQREEHHQELNTKRLDKLWAKKQEEKERRVKKIRNEHIKAIRKLTKKHKNIEGKLERRDVVKDFSDYGSQTYAPLTRLGVFLDRGSEQFVVKSRFINTYQGLLELEQSLPDFVVAPRVKAPKPKSSTRAGFIKRKYRQERELAEIHQLIKENRTKVAEPPKPLRFLEKIEKPAPRPPTPSVEVPLEEEEEKELAVIFLQQLIRGRAVQNMMFEGKEKRKDLIRELRSTHALQEAEQQIKKQEKLATLALQRQRRLHEHKESLIDEGLSEAEGSSMGDMLDFLSKELIRLQEERRIHAFSMLAERERRIREAEESGKRQVEERRRREEDEIFKQVIKVHQQTVDSYLEDVILDAIDKTADSQARSEIQEMAKKINDIAYEMEERRTNLESEEIVSELVHGFLIPEVQKQTFREQIHRQQRKYLNAAHQEIYKAGEGVIDMYPRPDKVVASGSGQPQAGHITPQAGTPKQQSRSGTPQVGTPKQQSRSGTPQAGTPKQQSRSGTPQAGTPPQQSRSGTPQAGTPPQQSRSGTPQAGTPKQQSRSGTPQAGTPKQQSRSGTPQAGTPTQQSRSGTPQAGTPPQQSRSGTPQAGTPKQQSRSGTPQAGTPKQQSRSGTPQAGTPPRQQSPQADRSRGNTPDAQRASSTSPKPTDPDTDRKSPTESVQDTEKLEKPEDNQ